MTDIGDTRSEITMLYDFYSALLGARQRQVVEMYYMEDMSLGGISEETGITRQGVRDSLKKAEKTLRQTEEKLGLVAKFSLSQKRFEYISKRLDEIGGETGIDFSDVILAAREIAE